MATQGVPMVSGGADENRKIGNIFILNVKHIIPAAREACVAAALSVGFTVKDLELKTRITLFPEVSDDPEMRELSRAALSVYLKLCPFPHERYIWNKQLASADDERFLDPDQVRNEKSGRAARDATERSRAESFARSKGEDELALAESMRSSRRVDEDAAESDINLSQGEPDAEAADPHALNGTFRGVPLRSGVEFSAEEAAELGFTGANVGQPVRKPKAKSKK